MILILLGLCVFLYWLGGQEWAHTLFRDIGCTLCIYAITYLLFGWDWRYLACFTITAVGFTIGDHENWYWAIHGFIVGLGLAVVFFWAGLGVAVLSALGTYLVSRFLSKGGVDVISRGALYGSLPLILFYTRGFIWQ